MQRFEILRRMAPVLALALISIACGRIEDNPRSRFTLSVAPLDLPNVTDACYALDVTNEDGISVWSKDHICASRYGAAGDLTYVGACDPTDGADADFIRTNTVRLILESVEQNGAPLDDFVNPCPAPTGCSQAAECVENGDTIVEFNLTLMRRAKQGFFDIGVDFEDIFCSAKLDCTASDGTPLELLHHPNTGERAPTAVMGLSCTPGANAVDTYLYRDDIRVVCVNSNGEVTRTSEVDAAAGPGRVSPVSTGDSPILFDAAIHRGTAAGGMLYWNILLGLELEPGLTDSCRLAGFATASAISLPGGSTPPHTRYPVIRWDAPLTALGALACTRHPLDAGPEVSSVYTSFQEPKVLPVEFHHETVTRLGPSQQCLDGATSPCVDGLVTTVDDHCDGDGMCIGTVCSGVDCIGNGTAASGPAAARLSVDGVSLIVPEGTSGTLSIESSTLPPPTIAENGATLLAVSPVFELGPHGTIFDPPLEVSFRVGTATDLEVYWSEDGQAWTSVPSTRDGEILTVTTSHFSYTTVVTNPCTGKTAGAICGTAPTSPCATAPTCQSVGGVLSCLANYKPATTLCRPANGPCDAPDYCSGTFASCPGDALLPSGQSCRAAAGPCDVAETCTGASPSCPTDQRAPYGTTCRSAAGVCDIAEICTGSTTACPPDVLRSASSVCRLSAGACDPAETCTGSNPTCPADSLAPSSTLCRGAAGECDVAETCTGSSPTCPADVYLDTTSVCRGVSGGCDVAETCTGSSPTCPADAFLGATSVCRSAAGACDAAETCSGTSATCPTDALLPSTTVCRPALGVCDVAETCTGLSSTCPDDAFVTNATPQCRDVASCEVKILGGSAGEELGFGFSAIGDINGDGKDDVGVGARNQATGTDKIGAVYIVDGTVLGHYSVADPTNLHKTLGRWKSGVAGDAFGTALSVADVTDDGIVDLVVGAPETPNTQYGVCKDGMIYAWAGPLSGTSLGTAASAVATIRGLGTYVSPLDGKLRCESDRVGYRLSSADVSGDGNIDILSASSWPLATGSHNAAYVFAGPVSGALQAATAYTKIHPSVPESAFSAFTNVGWGDFNADGVADMLLGNGRDDSGATDGGAVYLFSGPVSSGTLDITSASAVIRATTASEYFGNLGDGHFVVADFDGDGYDDVLVGSFGQTYVGATAGAVYLFLGPLSGNLTTANAAATWYGSQAAGEAADSALAGDFNGDGDLDIIIGSDGANYGGNRAGGTYIYFGPFSGSYLLTDANLILHGSGAQDEVGFWVAGLGDVNSDGLDDIAITAPWDDENGTDAGAVYICFGAP